MNDSSATQAKAIIVDDSSTMRSVLNGILTSEGIKVVGQLSSGYQLLELIARTSPDIVCLDYNLPDTNGIELLQSIAAAYPHVAVLMITGEDNPDLKTKAAEHGATGFIRKPFSQDQICKELKLITLMQRFLASQEPSTAPITAVEGVAEFSGTTTAIIADDSRTMRLILAAILTNNGINVLGEATSGLQAVELVSSLKPDITCLDIDMPLMDGLEALKEIRKSNPATKVVMISGNSQRELVAEAIKAGASGYVIKPFDADKVSAVIAKALST